MCKSAILFSKRDYSLGEALRYVCRDQKINLTYCLTFPEVIHNVVNSNPEILFYDTESIEFNFKLYDEFVRSNFFFIPKIVLLAVNPTAYELNDPNIIVVNKRNFSNDVVNILNSVKEKQGKVLSSEKAEEIRNKTTKILSELGITTKYLGYEYIRELVLNVVEDKRVLQSFNKKLYPKLAMRYNTQVNNIERNIRNAITVASQRIKNKILFDEISGRGLLSNAGPVPSNKQFITWLVDKVGWVIKQFKIVTVCNNFFLPF